MSDILNKNYELSVWKNVNIKEKCSPLDSEIVSLYDEQGRLKTLIDIRDKQTLYSTGGGMELTSGGREEIVANLGLSASELTDIEPEDKKGQVNYVAGPIDDNSEHPWKGFAVTSEHMNTDSGTFEYEGDTYDTLGQQLEISTWTEGVPELSEEEICTLGDESTETIELGYIHCVYGTKVDGIIQVKWDSTLLESDRKVYKAEYEYEYIGIYIDNKSVIPAADADLKAGSYTWYKTEVEYFKEEKLMVIGGNEFSGLGKASDVKFTDNINGTHDLEFTLYSRYFDYSTDNFVNNIYTDNSVLTNESLVKLKLEDEWYDFVVKNITENSEDNSFIYQCSDVYINELGKTGYGITFDGELSNNSGTVSELLDEALLDTSWESGDSDTIIQFLDEALYSTTFDNPIIATNPYSGKTLNIDNYTYSITEDITPQSGKTYYYYNSTTQKYEEFTGSIFESNETYYERSNTIIYVFYSVIANQNPYFQFIYHTNDDYEIDEDSIIIEDDDTYYYGGWVIDGVGYNESNGSIPTFENVQFTIGKVSTDYRGNRIVRTQRSKYDNLTKQVVYLYTKENSNDTYYGYTDIEYRAPQYCQNWIINGSEPLSTTGWSTNNSGGTIDLEFKTDDSSNTSIYLKMKSGNIAFYNEGATNFSKPFIKNDKIIFRLRAKTSLDDTDYVDFTELKDSFYINIKKYNLLNEQYIPYDNDYFKITSDNFIAETFNPVAVSITSDEYEEHETSYYYYDNDDNKYVQCSSEIPYSYAKAYFINDIGYYYVILECQETMTQEMLDENKIGIFFTMNTGDTYYFDGIELYEAILSTTVPNNTTIHYYAPGEYVPADTITTYYYYKPLDWYIKTSQITYDWVSTVDNSEYLPIYNNFEKIKTIEIAQSNIYNITQELAETFECWAIFNINHESNGCIKTKNYKRIVPTQFYPNRTYYIYNDVNKSYLQYSQYALAGEQFNPNISYYTLDKDTGIYSYISIPETYNLLDIEDEDDFKEILALETIYIFDSNSGEYISVTKFDSTNTKYYEHNFDTIKGTISSTKTELYTIRQVDETLTYYLYTPKRQDKTITFKKYITNNNYAGFKYGINLKSITREIVSEDIASKIIVEDVENEYTEDGMCSIIDVDGNPTHQNFIYNFNYYIQKGLIDKDTLLNDLYGTNGYYTELDYIYKSNILNTKELKKLQAQKVYLDADVEFLTDEVSGLTATIEQLKTEIVKTYNYTYDELIQLYSTTPTDPIFTGTNNAKDKMEATTIEINSYDKAYQKLAVLKPQKAILDGQITDLERTINSQSAQYQNLNYAFEQKYASFIQEGTWVDNNQLSNELYYYDAVGVSNTSKAPQVNYTIDVIDLSVLEDYKLFNFKIGDKTTVEDKDFFGRYKEEVIVKEITYNLDKPEETTITVQNYKTRFEDLFQRVAANMQTLEYRSAGYDRAAAVVNTDGTLSVEALQTTLLNNDLVYTTNPCVNIDSFGVTVSAAEDGNRLLRLGAGGISISSNKGINWTPIIDGYGINIGTLKAGQISTDKIEIFGGDDYPHFRWDKYGINAYDQTTDEDDSRTITNYDKFVRHDKYGIYGVDISNDNKGWVPNETSETSIYNQIKDTGVFGLTYDGFFLKSKQSDDDISGYVEFDTESDLLIKQYQKDQNDKTVEVTRIELGLLKSMGTEDNSYFVFEAGKSDNFIGDWDKYIGKPNKEDEDLEDGEINNFLVIDDDGEEKRGNFYTLNTTTGQVDPLDTSILTPVEDVEYYLSSSADSTKSYTLQTENVYKYYAHALKEKTTSNDEPEEPDLSIRDVVLQTGMTYSLKFETGFNMDDFSFTLYIGDSYVSPQELRNNEFNFTYQPRNSAGELSDKLETGTILIEATINNSEKTIEDLQEQIQLVNLDYYNENSTYGLRINDIYGAPALQTTSDGELWLKKILRIGPKYFSTELDNAKLGTVQSFYHVGDEIFETQGTAGSSYSKILSIQGIENEEWFNHREYYPLYETENTVVDDDVIALYDDGFLYAKNAQIEGHIVANSGNIGGLIIDEWSTDTYNDAGVHSRNYTPTGSDGFMLKYNGDLYINNGIFKGQTLKINDYTMQENFSVFGTFKRLIGEVEHEQYTKITIGVDENDSSVGLNGLQIHSGDILYTSASPNNEDYDINESYYIKNSDNYEVVPINSGYKDDTEGRKVYYWNGTDMEEVPVSKRITGVQYFWKNFETDKTYVTIDNSQKIDWTNMLNLQSDNAFFLYKEQNAEALAAKVTMGAVSVKNVGTMLGTQGIFNRLRFSTDYLDNRKDIMKKLRDEDQDDSELGNFMWECRSSDGHLSLKLV